MNSAGLRNDCSNRTALSHSCECAARRGAGLCIVETDLAGIKHEIQNIMLVLPVSQILCVHVGTCVCKCVLPLSGYHLVTIQVRFISQFLTAASRT